MWWVLFGALLGAGVLEVPGLFVGAAIGGLVAAARRMQSRVETLQAEHAKLQAEVTQLGADVARLRRSQAGAPADRAAAEPGLDTLRAQPGPGDSQPRRGDTLPPLAPSDDVLTARPPANAPPADAPPTNQTPTTRAPEPVVVSPAAHVAVKPPVADQGAPWADTLLSAPVRWLFGGNTVVRVGIVVLLVGVTLLLKYAAESALFPLEARLTMAAVLGLGLVALGVRQRKTRPGFATTLQGGGIAATYLVVFFAYRTYGLLPSGLAFGLLAGLAVGSAVLALAQDAMVLVLIGQIGGFLAPVLASSGSGNHVALFSYYLLLNLAVFGIALRRAYRPLNLVGFVFTFGVGTFWGVLRYDSSQFATTEPFLIAFFLLYVGIAVLYALRHQTRGWLDSSLLFGAPLAFLGLQLALVEDIPFAMAYTTLGVAALYLGLAYYLRKRAPDGLRAMSDAFVALGVGFGTLAVPYGLDNAGLTGATWALEGAGAYWVGVRQNRRLPRAAGVLLQLLAGGAMVVHAINENAVPVPLANTRMLGAVLLATGSLFIAHQAYRHRESVARFEGWGLQLLIPWALLFLFSFGLAEIDDQVPAAYEVAVTVGLVAALGGVCALLGRKLAWGPMCYPAALQQLLWLPLALLWREEVDPLLLAGGGIFTWPVWFASMALGLMAVNSGSRWLKLLHPLALWNTLAWLSVLWLGLLPGTLGLGEDWGWAAVLLTGAGGLLATTRGVRAGRAPFSAHPALYLGLGAAGVVCAAALALLHTTLTLTGDVRPLGYVPVVNPLDIAQLLMLGAMLFWARAARGSVLEGWPAELLPAMAPAMGGFAFLWWNGLLARSVHRYADTPFGPELLEAVPFQVALSLSWTLIGLVVTVVASRTGRRLLWFVGAALLGVVVLKLFALDLGQLSAVAKIGTFLVVGLLLLVVGFVAPVPPSHGDDVPPQDSTSQDDPPQDSPPQDSPPQDSPPQDAPPESMEPQR